VANKLTVSSILWWSNSNQIVLFRTFIAASNGIPYLNINFKSLHKVANYIDVPCLVD
jgi:hypothetical protein